MKKLSLLFIAILLLKSNIFAQVGWFEQISVTTENLNSVFFMDENLGWAVGDSGTALYTTDGGTNWSLQTSITAEDLNSVFIYHIIIVAVGDNGVIIRSTDNGTTWTSVVSGTVNNLYAIDFTDYSSNTAFAVGDSGTILKTTDGGINWTPQTSGTSTSLNTVFFVNNNFGWAAGDSSIILHTTNSGQDWVEQFYYVPNSSINSIFFSDEFKGWAAGHGDLFPVLTQIWRTTDGGNNWGLQEWGSGGLTSVYFADSLIGWMSDTGTKIYKTTNGGENWFEQQIPPNIITNSLFFVNQNIGWAVGIAGKILHTTNGGITFIEEEETNNVPTEFLLSHNFPNPFNPSTIIKYSIPKTSNVVIKVFDILGDEIEILVNEEKPTGIYKITWYAENLPSGVYFYQISAGNFIQTKKMILLK